MGTGGVSFFVYVSVLPGVPGVLLLVLGFRPVPEISFCFRDEQEQRSRPRPRRDRDFVLPARSRLAGRLPPLEDPFRRSRMPRKARP